MTLADPEKLRHEAAEWREAAPDWGAPMSLELLGVADQLEAAASALDSQAAEIAELRREWESACERLAATDHNIKLMGEHAESLKARLFEMQNAAIEINGKLAAAEAERATMRRALESIGKNVCLREPMAAAYARGVLAELKDPTP